MRFSDLETYVAAGYQAAGYDPTSTAFPVISPGPSTVAELQKLSPDRIVFLTLGGGPGLTSEELFDRLFITCRVIGRQEDFTDAETLAWQLDDMFVKIDHNGMIGTAKVLYVVRSGGGPVLLEKDAAGRYHFTCTYVTEAKR